jgi:hypothetical protein
MARIEKTVFISYRRTDEPWALAVFENLTQHGFDVFIDYDGIASGNFATVISENIKARAHFLVLLTPTALERCHDPKDWMRREIEAALDSQRNIVPLMLAGFDFGTPAVVGQLTGKLAALKEYNGLEIPKGYFSPAMKRLRNKFLSVSLETVLHPASGSAQQVAKEQKDKATMAAEEVRQQAKDAVVEARRTAEQARSTEEAAQNPLSAKAQDTLKRLAGICEDEDLAEAKDLVEELRDKALYETMGALVEAISRRDPKDARNRRLYGQYLINTGKATAAIDLLTPLAQRLEKGDPEFAEVMGLIGRANKHIFLDAGDKADPLARTAIDQAIAAYRVPFEDSPEKNTWHGVNLLALLHRARRLGLHTAPDLSPGQVAKSVVAELAAIPKEKRDPVWYLPTLAEASLGLGDWDAVEGNVRAYAASDQVRPFQIESTLRQFTEVWDIETLDERGRGLVATLRARLLQPTGGEIGASAEDVRRWREQAPPTPGQLEAILGSEGPQTYKWWRTGLERASSVCAVRQRLGQRSGSGFLLKAGTLGLQPSDELVVLTNFHVVNKEGALGALTPETAEVAFEAANAPNQAWPVKTILWSSPPARHDASVLRLEGTVAGVTPLPLASTLPPVEANTKVYIIGHPRGQDLAFSFHDNELLDHEGPPGGAPQISGVSRVHYRTPTEPASSGSPVFNANSWEVIALHHKGGKDDLPRLNGKAGSYAANEGISILSIKGAIERGEMDGH